MQTLLAIIVKHFKDYIKYPAILWYILLLIEALFVIYITNNLPQLWILLILLFIIKSIYIYLHTIWDYKGTYRIAVPDVLSLLIILCFYL